MDQDLYYFALCVALPLMLFFGVHMLFARTPDKTIFSNFLLSRRIMGVALLVLAANYSVHYFCSPRLTNVNATISINLATYFLCYWLFSSALITLLNNRYITRRRIVLHLTMWLMFSTLSFVVIRWIPCGIAQNVSLAALAVWLLTYGTVLAVRMHRTYRKALKTFNDTHSDDIGAYIRWLSVFTYWAAFFGVGCSILTFLPNKYIYIWVLSAIPFYIYLYCCYQNYMLFYERVETAFQEDMTMEQSKPGLTLKDLSDSLRTNRTYLSEYINSVYNMTFRDWIADLRIQYAKRCMQEHPEQKILEISERSGFLSPSHFTKTFSEKEGCSPARWRKNSGE